MGRLILTQTLQTSTALEKEQTGNKDGFLSCVNFFVYVWRKGEVSQGFGGET